MTLHLPVGRILAVLAIAGLGYLDWHLWTTTPDTSAIAAPVPALADHKPASGEAPAAKPAHLPPLESLTETVARPLFVPKRRPPSPQDSANVFPPAAPASGPPDGLTLLGTVLRLDGSSRALVATPDRPEGEWVEKGATVGGWMVSDILPDGVALHASGERRALMLYDRRETAETQQPAEPSEPKPRSRKTR